MTTTDLTRRRRTRRTDPTPEPARLAELDAMLADPAYAGWAAELAAARDELYAQASTTALAA